MRKFCYAGFGGLLLLIGCNVSDLDFSNLKIKDGEADVAVPFGLASYTMRELLESSSPDLVLNEDTETGEMWLSYSTSTSYTYDGSFIDATAPIDNSSIQNFSAVATDPAPRSIPFSFSFTQAYFQSAGESLDSIYFDAGNFDLDISTNLNATTGVISNYTVTIVELRQMGTGTAMSFNGTNISNGSPDAHGPVSIVDHKIKFTQVSGASHYRITVTGDIALNANQQLFGTERITVRTQFTGQGNEVIFGKFGKDTFDMAPQTMAIDFFENLNIQGIRFGGAVINFDCRSSFGIPIGLGLSGVYGEDANAVQTFMGGSVVTSPRVILSSSLAHPITGAVRQTLITINNQNSNLTDILAASPTSLNFNIQGLTNPANTTTLNFVTDTSSVRTTMELYIPMEVSLENVQYTMDFDIAGEAELSAVDSAALRVVTTNELPFGGKFDMFILDAADAILYTAAENVAFDQPFLNFDRSVREPKVSADDVPLSKVGLEALQNGAKVRLVFTLNSPVSQTTEDIFVKILAGAKMDVQLGARFIITTDL